MLLLQRRRKRFLQFFADVAFILFVWTVPDTTLCSAYLESQPNGEEKNSLTVDELQQRYLAATVTEINAIADKDKSVGGPEIECSSALPAGF